MANKNDFTPEEWTKVLESIMVTGIAVSAADPSGLWGTLKEAAAGSLALAAAKRDPILTNSSRQQLLILKHHPREASLQCASAFPRRSPRNVYSFQQEGFRKRYIYMRRAFYLLLASALLLTGLAFSAIEIAQARSLSCFSTL